MTTFNAIEVYQDAGLKAGTARRQGDESQAEFHSDWAKRAIKLESGDYQEKALYAFREAYRKGASIQ